MIHLKTKDSKGRGIIFDEITFNNFKNLILEILIKNFEDFGDEKISISLLKRRIGEKTKGSHNKKYRGFSYLYYKNYEELGFEIINENNKIYITL